MTSETEQTERVRNQGKPDGLFRACMDVIRTSHSVGQSLRTAALAAGLLSDARCYAELLGQFYVATAAMENRMDELLKSRDGELRQVKELGYNFSGGYERDLEHLLGPGWRRTIDNWTTDPAKNYVKRLVVADEKELMAAAFILWGPLVIGGGAILKPRVKKSFGVGATNVFDDVVGAAGGGRSGRRRKFIETYDGLLGNEGNGTKSREFAEIVEAAGSFMALNNDMMTAVRQRPWWSNYVWAGVAAISLIVVWKLKSVLR